MVNVLGNYVATIYANQILTILTKRLGLASRVTRAFDLDRIVERGDTIKIRRPMKIPATAMPASTTALTPDNITLNMNRWYGNTISVTDKELAQAASNLIPSHLPSLAYGIADAIDIDLASLIPTVAHSFYAAGSTVAVGDVTGVQKKLIDLQCDTQDLQNMFFMIGGQENKDLLDLAAYSQWQGGGPTAAATQTSSEIGQRYGFNFFVNQNRPVLGTATAASGYADISDFAGATVTSIVAKGAVSMPVTALGTAEVYRKGTIIKMTSGADIGSEYALTADATMSSGAGTFAINPGARNAIAISDTFSIGKTQGETTPNQDNKAAINQNVGFNRGWAALSMGLLPNYSEWPGMNAVQVSSIQDPVSGLSVRVRIGYDFANASPLVGCDALWGFCELNPEMACRLEIPAL